MSAPHSAAPTRLWLVRHGETDWNVAGRWQGQTDIPLNAVGLAQARDLLPTFAGHTIAAIYSSDLQRATTTAGILAEALGLTVTVDPGLREARLGAWEGLLHADILTQHADSWEARRRDPVNSFPPGGESLAQVAARATRVVNAIAQRHPGQQVILVSHGLLLAAIRCLALGLPLNQAFTMVPANCCPEPVDWAVSAALGD